MEPTGWALGFEKEPPCALSPSVHTAVWMLTLRASLHVSTQSLSFPGFHVVTLPASILPGASSGLLVPDSTAGLGQVQGSAGFHPWLLGLGRPLALLTSASPLRMGHWARCP